MNEEDKSSFSSFVPPTITQRQFIIGVSVIFLIMISGYLFLIRANSALSAKDKAYQELKEKQSALEDNVKDSQRKFDVIAEQLKLVSKNYEEVLPKTEECTQKNILLQTKYDDLVKENERLKMDLKASQANSTKAPEAAKPTAAPSATMSDPKAE